MTTPPTKQLPFEVVEADIGLLARTGDPWLAVVSSDDSYLSHRGGSSRAIWTAAGLPQDLSSKFPTPPPLGSIVA